MTERRPGRRPAGSRRAAVRQRPAGRTPSRRSAARPTTEGGTRAERRAAVSRRRARVALGLAVAFAAVVLGTSLPVHLLLAQRAEEAATAADVRHLEAENQSLAAQAAALSSRTTVEALAHSELNEVLPGQRTFDVVAASAGAPSAAGHEQLDAPPVLPGSAASEAAIGLLTGSGSAVGGQPDTGRRPSRRAAAGGGMLARMLRDLEFWR